MARTIAEIYDSIVAEKQAQTSLAGLLPVGESASGLLAALTSGSKVAVWRLWAHVIAVAMHTEEVLWDLFKVEIEAIAAAAPTGTVRWYRAQMFIFQFGDELVYIEEKYRYAVLDAEKQIVKYCAIEERPDGVVVVKTAKEAGSAPTVLNAAELAALDSYSQKIKFAGTRLAVLSLNADSINADYEIFYDPIIPLTEVQSATQVAVDNYLADTDFNGAFNVNDFTDVLQTITGIIDPVFDSATATTADSTVTNFGIEYVPAAGYFEYADTVQNMFTWTPQVQA